LIRSAFRPHERGGEMHHRTNGSINRARHVNKIGVAVAVIVLCALSFALGHWHATRVERATLASSIKAIAIWRESDWQGSSIRYARFIQLIKADQEQMAIDQACQEIARNTKNIREIQSVIGRSDSDDVPAASQKVFASACEGHG
jgi:hypothetical protein